MLGMDKHQDVIRQILLLLDTVEEGLDHMQEQLNSLDFEGAHELLNDCFMAMMTIKESLRPVKLDQDSRIYQEIENKLMTCFKETVLIFTEGKTQDYRRSLKQLDVYFKAWKSLLLKAITPWGHH